MSFSPSSEFKNKSFFLEKYNSLSIIDFGRYLPQTEQSLDEPNGIHDWTQSPSITNDIPSLMSLSTAPPSIITTNMTPTAIIITEE
jgi:hypothetical protein